ncbi:MAG: flavin reductase family protein [Candidatus Hadarchaeales archaeon]
MRVELKNAYKLLGPRPVVLITTVDKQGRINAAPMSWVTPVESEPPIIAFSTSYESDTYHNICETEEFVVNLVPESIKEKMYICGKSFPRGVNELEKAKLAWEPSEKVKPPRVVECPVNFECKLEWMHKGPEYVVIAGRVLVAHADENAVEDGMLNAKKVKPLLHLSNKTFAVGDRVVRL